MTDFGRRICLGVACLLMVVSANAQEVVLSSADGKISLSGTILDYDGEFYRLNTAFGEMTLRALGLVCSGRACPDPGKYAADLIISGTADALNDLLPALIEDFSFSSATNSLRQDQDGAWTLFITDPVQIPVARIQGKPARAASAIADLTEEKIDIAIANRTANSREIQAAARKGAVDLAHDRYRQVLALDAVVFIVSPENPISSISRRDLGRVFSGAIRNWAELGGFDAPVVLMERDPSTDSNDAFRRAVFGSRASRPVAPARIFSSADELASAVVADPFALGATSFAGIRNAKPLAIREACGISQYPTLFGLQSGDYPLSHAIFLFSPKRRLAIFARNLMAYLRSESGQRAVSAAGFAGQNMTDVAFADQQERIANALREAGSGVTLAALRGFVAELSEARRLSATYRFVGHSTSLTARSRRYVTALARMIEAGDFDGREIIFAGFSDSKGSANGNRRVSRQRAVRVANRVRAAAQRADLSKIRIQTIGFGEVSPVACNGSLEGRRLNRRVEVWFR
ncbi:MAG: phosphate ABC transporter substrate-binding/OmpA family protein [Paracoccaceae bacterium]